MKTIHRMLGLLLAVWIVWVSHVFPKHEFPGSTLMVKKSVNRRFLISFPQNYRHNYIHFPDLSNSTAPALVNQIVTVWMV